MLAGVLSSPNLNTQSTLKGATAFDVCFPLHIVSAFIMPPLILWFYEKNLISPFKFHAPEDRKVTRALYAPHSFAQCRAALASHPKYRNTLGQIRLGPPHHTRNTHGLGPPICPIPFSNASPSRTPVLAHRLGARAPCPRSRSRRPRDRTTRGVRRRGSPRSTPRAFSAPRLRRASGASLRARGSRARSSARRWGSPSRGHNRTAGRRAVGGIVFPRPGPQGGSFGKSESGTASRPHPPTRPARGPRRPALLF